MTRSPVGGPGDRRILGGTLVLHWNGSAWKQVRSLRGLSSLTGVALVSARSGWAVGSSSGKSLVLHWNGAAWQRVHSPGPGGPYTPGVDGPYGVAAASARSAWAVGDSYKFPATFKTLVWHWNGAAWKEVRSPSPAASVLSGVAAVSATDAWAVVSNVTGHQKTLILHWNGKAWSRH